MSGICKPSKQNKSKRWRRSLANVVYTAVITLTTQLDQRGYAIAPQILTPKTVADFRERFHNQAFPRHGFRHVETVLPELRSLITAAPLAELLASLFSSPPKLIRALYFNKTQNTNWGVPWHQDKTIAVQQRIAIPGFSAWSVKQGVIHVQPPTRILEQILTLRIHLDPTNENNGALQAIPGSHRHGFLVRADIDRLKKERSPVTCCLNAGDVLMMQPLLLHSSRKSQTERDRRVIHLELTHQNLPGGLQWAMR
ncbi:MAG: phytanoyl-CoA dioxygenase family protein [Spirulina sp. SIO3F2]|nr:phytanoyl-CoA dioxygenase family protein [Spirulina sp. SIO3F2]